MGRRASAVLTAAAAALVLAAGSGAIIVPKHSIAGASLGDTRAEVRQELGQPRKVVHARNEFGSYTKFHYRRLNVFFQGNAGATSIETTRTGQRTPRGIHVGSTKNALLKAYPRVDCDYVGLHESVCLLGRPNVGNRVTVFRTAFGRVGQIEVEFVVD